MHHRRRVSYRRIIRGTLIAALLTLAAIAMALAAPEITGWVGFALIPLLSGAGAFELARNGDLASTSGGYIVKRAYFVLLVCSCAGWGVMAVLLLTAAR